LAGVKEVSERRLKLVILQDDLGLPLRQWPCDLIWQQLRHSAAAKEGRVDRGPAVVISSLHKLPA
jgi:hypothetical protein